MKFQNNKKEKQVVLNYALEDKMEKDRHLNHFLNIYIPIADLKLLDLEICLRDMLCIKYV